MSEENTTTDIALLPPAERALIVLSSTKTEEHLRELVQEAATVAEVIDPASREQAHRIGMRLKSARTTIEKTGKTAREDAQAFSKAVIAEEKRLIAITEAEEKRVIGLRDSYDAKIEAEKEAKRQAEAKRIAEIKRQIDGIRGLPLALAGAPSDEIAAELAAIDQFEPLPEVFGEFTEECVKAIEECVASLKDLHARVMAQEAAAALVEVQRKALEEANRAAAEALAAERAAMEAERAAIAKERAELEALRAAAAAPVVVETGAETEPLDVIVVEPVPTVEAELRGDRQAAPEGEPLIEGEIGEVDADITIVPTDWRIRSFAMHTAGQFDAMAAKVNQCGFTSFAGELRAVATALRDGQHDAALAKADHKALIAADNLLIDATVEAIDTLREEEQVAA